MCRLPGITEQKEKLERLKSMKEEQLEAGTFEGAIKIMDREIKILEKALEK